MDKEEQYNQDETIQHEEAKHASALEMAQRAYEDALARRDAVSRDQIKSLQDIVDRYSPPETLDQQEERQRREDNKRNLLSLISLGANIGNIANATTGGKYGGRSAKTADLVGSIDKANEQNLTRRMQRDEKRNLARQNQLALDANAANTDLNAAHQSLLLAQKAEQQARSDRAKMNLEAFKAANQSNENKRKIDAQFRIAEENNKIRRMQVANQSQANRDNKEYRERMASLKETEIGNLKDYRNAVLELRKQEIQNKAKGKKTDKIQLSTSDNNVYNVPVQAVKSPVIAGEISQYLPDEYAKRFNTATNDSERMNVIGAYLHDEQAHSGKIFDADGVTEKDLSVNFEAVKNILSTISSEEEDSENALDFNAVIEDDMDDWNNIFN